MTNKPPKTLKDKTEQVEKTLVEIWEALSPKLQNKRHLFERFFSIQTKTRKLTNYLEKENKNEQASR